jgi:hypothetical protein
MADSREDLQKKLQGWVGDYLAAINLNSDWLMHGISRYTFGLGAAPGMPSLDVSGSIGMGYLRGQPSSAKDANAAVVNLISQVGGPLVALPINIYKAAHSNDPDLFRRFQQSMPPFLKAIGDAWRSEDPSGAAASMMNPTLPWWLQATGGVRDSAGATTFPYNYQDGQTAMEHVLRYLNFQSTKLSLKKEEDQRLRQITDFYTARRAALLKDLAIAYQEHDREGIADARDAVKDYNSEVPYPALKVGGDEIRAAIQHRQRAQALGERGLPESGGKRFYQIYRSERERAGP